MEQLEGPASEILEAVHGELSKPPTDAALEGADFPTFDLATLVPSGKPPTARELSALNIRTGTSNICSL